MGKMFLPGIMGKRKKKKGKDDESILENEIFHIMEVSLKEALDMALDDILKEWK